MGGRHADGGDEDFRAVADRHFDQLVQLAVRVVVVRLSCGTADLGQGEVDAEGEIGGGQVGFEVVYDLEIFGCQLRSCSGWAGIEKGFAGGVCYLL